MTDEQKPHMVVIHLVFFMFPLYFAEDYHPAPAKFMVKAFEDAMEEGIEVLNENKRRSILMHNDFQKMKEKLEDNFDLIIRQKLEDVAKLGEKLMKMETEDSQDTMALKLRINEVDKMKEKLTKSVKTLKKQVEKADSNVGYP